MAGSEIYRVEIPIIVDDQTEAPLRQAEERVSRFQRTAERRTKMAREHMISLAKLKIEPVMKIKDQLTNSVLQADRLIKKLGMEEASPLIEAQDRASAVVARVDAALQAVDRGDVKVIAEMQGPLMDEIVKAKASLKALEGVRAGPVAELRGELFGQLTRAFTEAKKLDRLMVEPRATLRERVTWKAREIGSELRRLTSRGWEVTIRAKDKVTGAVKSIANRLTSPLALLGVGGGVAGVTGMGLGMVMEEQDLVSSFEVMLGSRQAAEKRMQELITFAGQTPFTRQEIWRSSRQLELMTKGALATGEGLRLVGDVAAGTVQPFEDVAMWFGRLYDGMASGRPIGEATSRLQEMGAISGESRARLEQLADSGRHISEIWPLAAKEFDRFAGLMEKQSKNLRNIMLGTKTFFTENVIKRWGQGVADALQPALTKFRTWRKENSETIQQMGDAIERFGRRVAGTLIGYIERAVKRMSDIMSDPKFQEATFSEKVRMLVEAGLDDVITWLDGPGKEKLTNTFVALGEASVKAYIAGMSALGTKAVDELKEGNIKGAAVPAAAMYLLGGGAIARGAWGMGKGALRGGKWLKGKLPKRGARVAMEVAEEMAATVEPAVKRKGVFPKLFGGKTPPPIVETINTRAHISPWYKPAGKQFWENIDTGKTYKREDIVRMHNEGTLRKYKELEKTFGKYPAVETKTSIGGRILPALDRLKGKLPRRGTATAGEIAATQATTKAVEQVIKTTPRAVIRNSAREIIKTEASATRSFEKTGVFKKIAPALENVSKVGPALKTAGKVAGRIAVPLAVGLEAYDIYKAKDKTKAVTQAATGLTSGIAGAKLGAAIGTAILPGIGTAIGGVLGGAGGYVTGRFIGGKAVDAARPKPAYAAQKAKADTMQTSAYLKEEVYEPFKSIVDRAESWGRNLIKNFMRGRDSAGMSMRGWLNPQVYEPFRSIVNRAESWGRNMMRNFEKGMQQVPVRLPAVTTVSPTISNLEKHAAGGILTRPHLGLVAEAGPEAIIPLSYKMRNRALDLWQKVGTMLGVMPELPKLTGQAVINPVLGLTPRLTQLIGDVAYKTSIIAPRSQKIFGSAVIESAFGFLPRLSELTGQAVITGDRDISEDIQYVTHVSETGKRFANVVEMKQYRNLERLKDDVIRDNIQRVTDVLETTKKFADVVNIEKYQRLIDEVAYPANINEPQLRTLPGKVLVKSELNDVLQLPPVKPILSKLSLDETQDKTISKNIQQTMDAIETTRRFVDIIGIEQYRTLKRMRNDISHYIQQKANISETTRKLTNVIDIEQYRNLKKTRNDTINENQMQFVTTENKIQTVFAGDIDTDKIEMVKKVAVGASQAADVGDNLVALTQAVNMSKALRPMDRAGRALGTVMNKAGRGTEKLLSKVPALGLILTAATTAIDIATVDDKKRAVVTNAGDILGGIADGAAIGGAIGTLVGGTGGAIGGEKFTGWLYDKLTKHASGGIMTYPHLGLVAEAGPEVIIPLSTRMRARALELYEKTGRILGVRPYAEGGLVETMTEGWREKTSVSSVLRDITARWESIKESFQAGREAGQVAVAHAIGGILTRPHLGMVAEAGPEAIIPLSTRMRARALALYEETGKRLGVRPYADGGFAGVIPESQEQKIPVNFTPSLSLATPGPATINLNFDLTGLVRQVVIENREDIDGAVDRIADAIANNLRAVFQNMTK